METFNVIIEINRKFSNGCEWYKESKTYEVYKWYGDYVHVGTGWGIRSIDAKRI